MNLLKRSLSALVAGGLVFASMYVGTRYDVEWIVGLVILVFAYPAAVEYLQLMKKLDIPLAAPEFLIWVPLLGYKRFVDNPELSKHIVDLDEFYEDAATGNLPAVAYIAPSGNSEHPPGSVQSGQALVRGLVNAMMRGSQWEQSAFMWSYDDWGGFYDHVKPPKVDEFGYGFRVPTLMVSPYAKRGFVDSTTYDFASIPKFIEVNWGLKPMASRDARANAFLDAFDFDAPPREPVLLNTERGVPEDKQTPTQVIYGMYVFMGLSVTGFTTAAMRRARRTGVGR